MKHLQMSVTWSKFHSNVLDKLSRYPWFHKTLVVCGLGVCLLVSRVIYKAVNGKINKSPPQLYGLPVFGSLFTLFYYKNKFRESILPKYGDLVTYNILHFKYYKINDLNLASKLLSATGAGHRAKIVDQVYTNIGIEPDFSMINDDKKWSYRRKKFMQSLTKVLNSSTVETEITKILNTVTFNYLNSKLNENNQFLWYPRQSIRNITFNIIYYSLFGKILGMYADHDRMYCLFVHMFLFVVCCLFVVTDLKSTATAHVKCKFEKNI